MAIYKRGREFKLGTTRAQIQQVARAGLEPGTAGLRVRSADHSATLPPYKSEKITERGRISRRPMIYLSRLAKSAPRSLTRSHWFSLGKLIGGKELATSFTNKIPQSC